MGFSNEAMNAGCLTAVRGGGAVQLWLSGTMDVAGVHEVEIEVWWAVEHAERSLSVDCRRVSFIDSAGARLLARTAEQARARDIDFQLSGASQTLRTVLAESSLRGDFSTS
jgi:anti-anti-sigma factor